MKRLRKLFYIALILVAVAGLIYTMSLDTSTPTAPPEEETAQAAVETTTEDGDVVMVARFEHLVYAVDNTQLQFELGEDDHWIWLDDTSFPLDDTLIAQLVADLDGMSYLRAVPFSEAVLPKDYGLENPWATLTATRSDGSTLTLDIGAQGTDENYYMIKDGDTEQALVYRADWVETLFEPIYNMMALPQLPALTKDTVQGYIVVAGEESGALYVAEDLSSWHFAGDDTLLEFPDLMETVTDFTLLKCFSFDPSEGALSICGFDTPSVITIAYWEDGETAVLTVYVGATSIDPVYQYVRINDDDTIYLVETAWIDTLLAAIGLA